MLLLAACLWGVTLAQNRTINPDVRIVGCPEFGCPNTTQNINRDWDTAECRLGFQTTAAAVGIAENVIEVPGTDTKLSLTMARKFYIKGGEPSPARVDRDENQMCTWYLSWLLLLLMPQVDGTSKEHTQLTDGFVRHAII